MEVASRSFIRQTDFSISPELSCVLDTLRTLAAFFVVIGHVKLELFENKPAANWTDALFVAINALGHDAVIVFFVLSGFLVGRAAVQTFILGLTTPTAYAIDRTTRIYAVLLPALVIGTVIDALMLHFWPNGPEVWIQQRQGAAIFLGNLAALQGIAVPVLGSNGPLWSLANESWYYIMFPLGLMALRERQRVRGLLWLLLLAMCAALVGKDILKYSTVWLIGAAIWPLRGSIFPRALCWILFAALVATADSTYLSMSGVGFAHDLGIALATALLINVYRGPRNGQRDIKRSSAESSAKRTTPGRFAKFAKLFAGFSYSVYLYHFPLLILIATMLRMQGIHPFAKSDLLSCSVWIGVSVLLYLYSYLLFLFTEDRYHLYRSFVQTQVRRWQSSPA